MLSSIVEKFSGTAGVAARDDVGFLTTKIP